MQGDHQNNRPVGGQWAEQQKKGMEKQQAAQLVAERHPALSDEERRNLEEDVAQVTGEEEAGENRTPEQTIGQVAHADRQKGKTGGAQTSPTEPEKQGGISGP